MAVVIATLGVSQAATALVPAAAGTGPALEPAAVMPALPTAAATFDPLSGAAADALSALWFGTPDYLAKLDQVIAHVAFRAHISPNMLRHVWENTDKTRMLVVLNALTQIGVHYRRYTASEGHGFDCSGLTSWAWSKVGVNLPRSSYQQVRAATRVDLSLAQPGDLLYYPGHVMLAVGVGTAMIHAPYTGANVEVRAMPLRKTSRIIAASPVG